ncbi:unnamed protein product [Sphagnum balticum]
MQRGLVSSKFEREERKRLMGFRDMEFADRMQGRMFVISFVAGSAAAWLPRGFAAVLLAGFSGEAAGGA